MSSASPDHLFSFAELLAQGDDGRDVRTGESLSDEAAIVAIARNDKNAMQALFRRYSKLVFSVGLRILNDPGEAEELVQEVYLRIMQKASLFDAGKGSAKSWIIQVTYHQAFDRRAYLARRRFYSGTDIEECSDTLACDLDVESSVGSKLSSEKVREAFAQLSPKQRLTLVMFFFEGLHFPEIAEQIGESLSNVRHYYYRGLDRLRESAFVRGCKDRKS